uniref:Uncharacterized protein n=1 Tax=Rhizobium rhizogenes TaxID=359 RepID=A0A7S4ZVE1_RHIRH|nr:hypothetical protein pC6.5d_725 [Rhizobium rhizogenes]
MPIASPPDFLVVRNPNALSMEKFPLLVHENRSQFRSWITMWG